MKIGLYFGSFNPIHIGHMAIANYLVEFTDLQQLWFVVSPQNPLKNKKSLLPEYQRLELVNIAIDDYPSFRASNIEFSLPKPSYTIDTLTYLSEKYPEHNFCPIIGADNLETFTKWKNYEVLLDLYQIYVYPRPNAPQTEFHSHPSFSFVEAPLMEISSSMIRDAIQDGRNVRFLLPGKVFEYIDEMNFYKK